MFEVNKMKKDIQKDLKKLGKIFFRLKEKGVLKTAKFTGEIGEYLVQNKFKLKRVKRGSGYDFLKGKKRIEVKTKTTLFNENPIMVGVFDNKLNFDVCWRVILDKDFQLKEIWEIPISVVKKALKNIKDKSRFSFSKKFSEKCKRIFPR